MELNKNNYCVIMAGGIGSRFWPMSRTDKPKQFLDVMGTGESLIQMTYHRFEKVCPKDNIYIVTNGMYKALITEQLKGIKEDRILCEPARRNTAPCIAYANFRILKDNPQANIIVAPSDHLILKEDVFLKVINQALAASAQNDILITLGIKPSYPNTGYGYIQYDKTRGLETDGEFRKVKLFTEKPNVEMAKKFIDSGDFLWNAGIFVWSLSAVNDAMREFLPDVFGAFNQGRELFGTDKEELFINETYTSCQSISIDYGVMEKAPNVYVMPCDFGWSDVGTWKALYEVRKKDGERNSVTGKNVMLYNSSDNIVTVDDDKLAVIQGMDDYIIVNTSNVLLICKKSEEQRVKQFLTDVEVKMGKEYL
ncbi:MAG: mannose-1-phosphate guanylyltransferase [Bacteroidales bacterium]|nr:mannose-1-phosphate guanylyltransferase [Bacteroidales bacterium]